MVRWECQPHYWWFRLWRCVLLIERDSDWRNDAGKHHAMSVRTFNLGRWTVVMAYVHPLHIRI
jgi:hypothetical protein